MAEFRPPPLKLLTTRPCAYETPPLPVAVLAPAAAATHIGLRPTQEDRIASLDVSCSAFPVASLYVMIDGHGGDGAACAVQMHLPALLRAHMHDLPCASTPADLEEACKRAFIDTERAFERERSAEVYVQPDEGACVLAMIVLPDALVFASAGDCRALLVHDTGPSAVAAEEHRCDSAAERERIRKAGLIVYQGRVNGVLAVSRSIGDFELKVRDMEESDGSQTAREHAEAQSQAQSSHTDESAHAVTCVPSTQTVLRTEAQLAVLLMTDGVHDCVPTADLTDLCREGPLAEVPARSIQRALVEFGHDNASMIMVPLK